MEFEARMFRSRSHLSSCFHRVLRAIPLLLIVILSCSIFCGVASGPFSWHDMRQPDGHGPFRNVYDVSCQDIYAGDISSSNYCGTSLTSFNLGNLENLCTNSHLFCFPSTLPGLFSKKHSYIAEVLEAYMSQSEIESPVRPSQFCRRISNSSFSSDHGMFKLSNGRIVSCSLASGEGINYMSSIWTHSGGQNYFSSYRGHNLDECGLLASKNGSSRMVELSSTDASSPHLEITPAILDWGQTSLYVASLAYLTVLNACNHSALHVYEPFSTNTQFYSCNDGEFLLEPGEAASMCFVFSPDLLGSSSAFLILQTSSGGFLVQAKGFAIESPYALQPLSGLDISSSGRLHKNLSLFNPYNETLLVEEVTVWIVSSFGNVSHSIGAHCDIQNSHESDQHIFLGSEEWLDVKRNRLDFQMMSLRPHGSWEIGPCSSEDIVEIDFSFGFVGKIFGVLSMQLLRSSEDKAHGVIVPIEAELGGKTTSDSLSDSVSVLIEALVPCDATEVVFSISLRNLSPRLLTVVKIFEVTERKELFQIRSVQGLILFPRTVTRVAVAASIELPNLWSAFGGIGDSCKINILTNDSTNPQFEIPCQGLLLSCFNCQQNSSNQYAYESVRVNKRTGPLSSSNSIQQSSDTEELEMAVADEMVLWNWKSHGRVSGMSVLDDQEISFSVVPIGTHHSKWITVKNPTEHPAVMQLILNSAEIIDQCRGQDMGPRRYGFSVAESSVTVVYVHPHGRADMGPISFEPSSRCEWRSSALIRNNISGVEWLTLHGLGRSHSLVLLEGSELVQRLEFDFAMGNPSDACSQQLSKELVAKNNGDLLLEVLKISVSGSDGFTVHGREGFTLEPGESTKLLVSHRPDFSAATVCSNLQLALATGGILTIPMKVTVSGSMFMLCEESFIWKYSPAFVLVASLMLVLSRCCLCRVMDSSLACAHSKMDSLPSRPLTQPFRGHCQANGRSDASSPELSPSPLKPEAHEESTSRSLVVKVTKERKRRRRKKKGGIAGLVGPVEACSSQSGNSTPSSSLSPVSPTPDPARNPFSKVASEPGSEQERAAPKPCKSPVCQPTGSRELLPVSPLSGLSSARTVPLYARAPGPRFCNSKNSESLEDERKFTYDIWGDHLSGLHLGSNRGFSVIGGEGGGGGGEEGNSDSFFVKGPRAFETKSQLRSLSCYCPGGW